VRGCLQKAKVKRPLPKGEFAWNIILALGRGADGKHKQKWVRFHGTRKQAEQKLTELTGEVQRGEFVEPSKTTLGEWLDKWLEMAIRPRCAPNTYSTYFRIMKVHLKPGLGHVLLQQLTPLHVERYYAEKKLAPGTVRMHHTVLTSALNAAVNEGVLRGNVTKRVMNKPRVRFGEDVLDNVWTADEARRFLAAVKQDGNAQYIALFALALDSGLRKGEMLGVQWKDIDGNKLRVERQLIHIERTSDSDVVQSGEPIFTLPKGKRARSLDLSEETVVMLREHKRQQAELKMANRLHYHDYGLVFAQAWEHKSSKHAVLGGPLNVMTVNKLLTRLCREAGVKRLTVHGLRHTCATLSFLANVPAHVVQRKLGHTSVEMTLNIYSHVLPSMGEDAASRLATLLYG